MDKLCSPLYCWNYREGLKSHWRLQPTMGSRSIASILFSCNWVCFWSLILEGKCCYSVFFFPLITKFLNFIYLFVHTLLHQWLANKLTFSKKGSYQENNKMGYILIHNLHRSCLLERFPHSSLSFEDHASSWACIHKKMQTGFISLN